MNSAGIDHPAIEARSLLFAGDPNFLESVDMFFEKAAALASPSSDVLAEIKVGDQILLVLSTVSCS